MLGRALAAAKAADRVRPMMRVEDAGGHLPACKPSRDERLRNCTFVRGLGLSAAPWPQQAPGQQQY